MSEYKYLQTGADIYKKSFAMIREETDLSRFPDDVSRVVVRMVHAAADPSIADSVAFTPGVVKAGREAIANGAPILCDSNMVAAGFIRSRLNGNKVVCHLRDPKLAEEAAQMKTTKTAAAVSRWMDEIDGAVVAIGNAPTALFRLLELLRDTSARPAAVIGIPVGFVGAAESKQALVDSDLGLEYITVLGRRGGSAMAVSAVNAIASPAE